MELLCGGHGPLLLSFLYILIKNEAFSARFGYSLLKALFLDDIYNRVRVEKRTRTYICHSWFRLSLLTLSILVHYFDFLF